MNRKINELVQVDCEAVTASTAASSSLNYSMEHYDNAMLVAHLESTGFTTATVDLMESSGATVAGTSAAGSKAGVVIGAQGGTGITTAGGVRVATLTLTTNTTGNKPSIRIGIGEDWRTFTYTTSTAQAGKTTAYTTVIYFGSTVGATANTGLQLPLNDLATAINNAAAFNGDINVSTGTTATIKLALKDTADGPLAITGDTGITITVQDAAAAFNLRAAELDSTANKKYLGLKVSTVGVAAAKAYTIVRGPGRYMPGKFKGYVST